MHSSLFVGWGRVINFTVYRESAEIIPNYWKIRVTVFGGTNLYIVQFIEGKNSKCFRNSNKNSNLDHSVYAITIYTIYDIIYKYSNIHAYINSALSQVKYYFSKPCMKTRLTKVFHYYNL